jgi:hypothetical protein
MAGYVIFCMKIINTSAFIYGILYVNNCKHYGSVDFVISYMTFEILMAKMSLLVF